MTQNSNDMEYAYFDTSRAHLECFELGMTIEDANMCCHSGVCDYDCENARSIDYLHDQLAELSNEQLFAAICEYIADEDITDHQNDREWLELYIIWLAAGDIVDEVYMRETAEA